MCGNAGRPRPPDASIVDVQSNSCGGRNITVHSGLRGYAEYHYNAEDRLVGALWHSFTDSGCAANLRYGTACTGKPSDMGGVPGRDRDRAVAVMV